MQQKLSTKQKRFQVQLFNTRTGQASLLQQPLITKGFTEGHTSKKKSENKKSSKKSSKKNTKQQGGERTQGTAAELAETILT